MSLSPPGSWPDREAIIMSLILTLQNLYWAIYRNRLAVNSAPSLRMPDAPARDGAGLVSEFPGLGKVAKLK
jgi:hypothetical protein